MTKNHIKRINAPKRWDILRKGKTFISRPNSGRNLELALSLNTVLKELLAKTGTTKETKYLIKYKQVLVNGVRRHDEKFPVGFIDVLSLPELEENYRLVVNDQDKLAMVKVSGHEAKLKISKVGNKTLLSSGKIQVNCTDGRNFLFEKKDAEQIATNDTILYTVPEQQVKEVLKLEKGALVFLYKGKHTGNLVRVEGFKGSNIIFKKGDEAFETKKTYALAVGKEKPLITVTGHIESSHAPAHAHAAAAQPEKAEAGEHKEKEKKPRKQAKQE
jgi:small subunit ribosomal protein S4e